MSATLYAYDVTAGRLPGQLTVDRGKITTATNPAMEGRARAVMASHGWSAEQALAFLDGWSNGHVIWSTSDQPPAWPPWLAGPVTAGWRADLHPRDRHGRFSGLGGGTSPDLARFAGRGLPMGSEDAQSAAAKAKVAKRLAGGMRSPTQDLVAAGGHDAASAWVHHDDPGWEFRLEPHTGFLQSRHAGGRAEPGWTAGGPGAETLFRQAAASNLVRQWAKTSNDHDGKALAIQEAARREFGLADTQQWSTSAEVDAWTKRELAAHERVYRDFVRAQYRATQADLAEAGITRLTLYRGMTWPSGTAAPAQFRTAGPVTLTPRPLASWSYNQDAATSYAHGVGPTQSGGGHGAVISADIPAADIVSYPQAGMGSLGLGEFVVRGSGGRDAHVALAAAGEPVVAGSDADRNEDWLRASGWDLPGIDDLPHLLTALDLDGQPPEVQRAGVEAFTTLPAWEAAPAPLVLAVQEYLGSGHA